MEIRNVREDEFDDLIALWQYAFQYQLTPERLEEERKAFRPEHHWGLFDGGGRLLTNVSLLPLDVWIGGVKMKMGGIASVSSWPDARRQGGVSRLLAHAFETMRANGQTVSMLAPFSMPFYRKYGYELAVSRKQYKLETKHLPPRRDVPGTVSLEPKQADRLRAVYDAFAPRYDGMLARTDDWWARRVLSKPGWAAVYRNERGEPEGYLLYEVANRVMRVHEWVHVTETARAALWNFVGQHDSMIDEMTMPAPEDDPLSYLVPEPRFKQEIEPYFMARIVDVEAFLRQYPFQPSNGEPGAALALRVEDGRAPWNDGWFRLALPSGGRGAAIDRADSPGKLPVAECDVQTLAAMLAGGRRPAMLAGIGRLRGDAEAIAALERSVPARASYLLDFF